MILYHKNNHNHIRIFCLITILDVICRNICSSKWKLFCHEKNTIYLLYRLNRYPCAEAYYDITWYFLLSFSTYLRKMMGQYRNEHFSALFFSRKINIIMFGYYKMFWNFLLGMTEPFIKSLASNLSGCEDGGEIDTESYIEALRLVLNKYPNTSKYVPNTSRNVISPHSCLTPHRISQTAE